MDKKKIVIIGTGHTGLSTAIAHAARHNNICALHSVVDSQFTEPKKDEVFTITRLPELPEIWIDPKEPVFNHQKHIQTCAKNRKNRKKKRR
jgi:NADH dehydrogenase FAD-containing subunit